MDKRLKEKLAELSDNERTKLLELHRDKNKGAEEGAKLEWMYRGNKRDAEEYLTGRRIDNAITEELKDETIKTDAPGAKFAEVINRRADLDMQVKMREDPLYAIRRREEEVKRQLLENPIRMKQLQKAIELKQAKQEKKAKKALKKQKKLEKKMKKKNKPKADSESEFSSSDDERLKQYLAILERKKAPSGHPRGGGESQPSRSDDTGCDRMRNRSDDRAGGYRGRHEKMEGRGSLQVSDRNEFDGRESKRGPMERRDVGKEKQDGFGKNRQVERDGEDFSRRGEAFGYGNRVGDGHGRRDDRVRRDFRRDGRGREDEIKRNHRSRSPVDRRGEDDDRSRRFDSNERHSDDGGFATSGTLRVDGDAKDRHRTEDFQKKGKAHSSSFGDDDERFNRKRRLTDAGKRDYRPAANTSRDISPESRNADDVQDKAKLKASKNRTSSLDGPSPKKAKKKSKHCEEQTNKDQKDVARLESSTGEDRRHKKKKKRNDSASEHSEIVSKNSKKKKRNDSSSDRSESVSHSDLDDSSVERRKTKKGVPYGLILSDKAAEAAALKPRESVVSTSELDTQKSLVKEPVAKKNREIKRRLTEVEKTRLREEMMANARERDVERESNVRRYREDIAREARATEETQALAAEFVKPMMAQHAAELTVEARIKRNKYNIQRTAADLDKNFARR